jgi:hypothetical protein
MQVCPELLVGSDIFLDLSNFLASLSEIAVTCTLAEVKIQLHQVFGRKPHLIIVDEAQHAAGKFSNGFASADLSSHRSVLREIMICCKEDGFINNLVSGMGTGINLAEFQQSLISSAAKQSPVVTFHNTGFFDSEDEQWEYVIGYLWPGKSLKDLSCDNQRFLRRLFQLLRGRLVS